MECGMHFSNLSKTGRNIRTNISEGQGFLNTSLKMGDTFGQSKIMGAGFATDDWNSSSRD
jgi:hypothetical protein